MSEGKQTERDVTVIFHHGDSLIVPPFELPRESRQGRETYEDVLHRLCNDHGVVGYADYTVPLLGIDRSDAPITYLMEPRRGELSGSEFKVHHSAIPEHLHSHPYLSALEKNLVSRAAILIESFSIPQRQRREFIGNTIAERALLNVA